MLVWPAALQAQDPRVVGREWSRIWGTTNTEWGNSVCVDDAGYIYTVGKRLCPTSSLYSTYDITKFDQEGDRLWAQTYSATESLNFLCASVADAGTSLVYVSGWESPGLVGPGSNNVGYLAALDTEGVKQWEKRWGPWSVPTAIPQLGALCVATDRSAVVAYLCRLDAGGITNPGAQDMFVAKVNTGGTTEWTRIWDSGYADTPMDVCSDGADHLYLAGVQNDSIATFSTAVVMKLDLGGNIVWTHTWSTVDSWDGPAALGICCDGTDSIYVVGGTQGSFDGQTNAGMYDSFMSKFNAAGDRLWSRIWGGPWEEKATGVGMSPFGEVVAVSDKMIGPGSWELASYTPEGSHVWTRTWGPITNAGWAWPGPRLDVFGTNVFVAHGVYSGEWDGQTNAGEQDFGLAKWNLDYQPELQAPGAAGSNVMLGWHGAWNCTFDVEVSTNLCNTNAWALLAGYTNLPGSEFMTATDSPPVRARFYRVKATSND